MSTWPLVALASFSIAVAADTPLSGKDLASIVQSGAAQHAAQSKYIGKTFSDHVSYWRRGGSGWRITIEVTAFDDKRRSSHDSASYIDCTVDANQPVAQLLTAGKLKQGDKLTISGQVGDIVSAPTAEEPGRRLLVLAGGCVITPGWGK